MADDWFIRSTGAWLSSHARIHLYLSEPTRRAGSRAGAFVRADPAGRIRRRLSGPHALAFPRGRSRTLAGLLLWRLPACGPGSWARLGGHAAQHPTVADNADAPQLIRPHAPRQQVGARLRPSIGAAPGLPRFPSAEHNALCADGRRFDSWRRVGGRA